MTAKEYIVQEYGETWLRTEWSAGDVIDTLEEYGKYCAEEAYYMDSHAPFENWWSEFQIKEEAK